MDDILAEINLKRKTLSDPVGAAGPSKYLKKADLDKARAEEERLKQEEADRPAREAREAKAKKAKEEAERAKKASLARLASTSRNTPDTSGASTPPVEGFNISPEECVRRLRAKGQPIRLFGESDKDRRLRLRALELLEEREWGSAGSNEFRKALQDFESGMNQKDVEKRAAAMLAKRKAEEEEGDGPREEKDKVAVEKRPALPEEILDLRLFKTDRNKLYPLIYYALKGVWREWGEALEARPDSVKRTHQGKVAATTQMQSGVYLKPLFKLLRTRTLDLDVLRLLAEIVHHMQSRQYQKANDAYLRLSIGNAAWPIGVTAVGIHERSAAEKITEDSNVAHVLNDEVSRKYIQSVKRLLTFSQTVRPPDDISQLMG